MDVAVGWNGVVRSGFYSPLIVSLENQGKKLQCTVSVDVRTGSELRGTVFTSTYSQQAVLPARSGKRLFFVLPFSNATLPVIARVQVGGAEILSKEVDVGSKIVEQKIVMAISSELSLDFLSGLIEGIRVVYPHIENLPDSWAGYDAVDMVVLHDTAFQNLRAAQVSALEQWVFSGGALVVSGGPPALQLLTSGLQRLLPVEIGDLEPRSRIRSLGEAVGRRGELSGEMILARSRPRTGSVLAEEDGIPILAERRLGSGFVRFLAFDCTQKPAVSWSGNAALWKLLSARGARPAEGGPAVDPVDDPWLKGILGAQDVSFPSGIVLFATLAGYFIAIFAVTLLWKKKGAKALVRAVLIFFLAAAATASTWVLFRLVLYRGDFMVEASIAEAVSGDGLAKITGKVAFVSTGGGEFGVSTPIKTVTAVDAVPLHRGSTVRSLLIESGSGTEFKSIRLGKFGSRLLTLEAVAEMEVSAEISGSDSRRTLVVENGSPYALESCFIRYKSSLYRVADVPAGGRAERSFGVSEDGDGVDAVLPDVRRYAFFKQVRDGFDREKPLFFAWTDVSMLSLESLSDAAAFADRSVNLLAVEVR